MHFLILSSLLVYDFIDFCRRPQADPKGPKQLVNEE